MNNIEEQLKKLPKAKLRLKADLLIRTRLYRVLWRERLAAFNFYQRRLAYSVVSLAILLLIAVPAYAYFNPSVGSDHFLFSVKTAIEQVELGLSFTPIAKYETLEKITGRRLAELEKLSVDQSQASEQAIINTVKAVIDNRQEADNELVKISSVKDLQTVKKIENNTKVDFKDRLAQSANNIGVKANDEIISNISLALDKFSGRWDGQRDVVDKLSPANKIWKNGFIINNDKEATSTENKPLTTENKQKKNDSETSLDVARQQLAATEENINLLPSDLPREKYQAEDVKILVDKLSSKIKKAKEALESGDMKKSDELIKTTKAITDNAKYFVRKNKDKNEKRKETATTTPAENSDISTSTKKVDDEVKATTSLQKSFKKMTDNKGNWKININNRRDGRDD